MDNLLLVKQPSGKIRESATVIPLPSVSLRPLQTVQFGAESVSSLRWNGCPVCRGISVQFGVEWVSSLARNTHKKFGVRVAPVVLLIDARGRPLADPIVGGDVAGLYGGYLDNAFEAAKSAMHR